MKEDSGRKCVTSDEARPGGTSGFDLAHSIVALANRRWTPNGELHQSPRVVDTVEWFQCTWPINDTKLRECTDVTLRSYSHLDRNVELKYELHKRFENADDEEREKLVRYYVKSWGGIKKIGDDTCRQYAHEPAEDLARRGLENIASRSKALVLHDPSCYAIYDSRVAVSLNYLVIRRVGHGDYIGQKNGRKCFPLPQPRAHWTQNAHEACRTLSEPERFNIPFYDKNEPDFYTDYLSGVREAAARLSASEGRKICLQWVESMLFGMAEQCAQGLYAACRLSEPLSFEVIAEQRKAALIDTVDQYRLPWTWEMSEEDLEARLRQFSEQVYRQFLREHPKS